MVFRDYARFNASERLPPGSDGGEQLRSVAHMALEILGVSAPQVPASAVVWRRLQHMDEARSNQPLDLPLVRFAICVPL